jgi:membrane protein YqaA with SNARE-associated domain
VVRLTVWVVRFGHNAALQRLIAAAAPLAGSRLFPVLGGLLAFLATLSLTIPVVPVLTALVVMNRARWRSITCWAVLGSASGGAVFTYLLGYFGAAFLNARMSQVVASPHWENSAEWVAEYGMVTLATIAALPVAQSPALILAAIFGMPWLHVFAALLIGKTVKYGLMGAITAGTVRHLAEFYEIVSVFIGHRR